MSDVDLAVLYRKTLTDDELTRVHSQAYEIISELLQSDDIDLINLNTVPLSMQYGAIKPAKILVLKARSRKLLAL